MQAGEGLHSDHVMHDPGGIGVVGTVVELLYHSWGVLKTVESVQQKN